MTELDRRAAKAMFSLKQAHADLESYCEIAEDIPGAEGMQRAMKALHEKMKRFGEDNHPDIVVLGGNT